MRSTPIFLALSFLTVGCSGSGGTPPPPVSAALAPPTGVGVPATTVAVAPGQILVTVAAFSTPPGATVTGGGQVLGTTPFTSQVPVPAPNPGDPPATFQFTFTLPGYQPTTITASPVNNTISLNAMLASALAPQVVGVGGTPPATTGGAMHVRGVGGGPVFDYHTTTATATVTSPCVIRALRVELDGNHTFNRDLEVSLRGPDGTSYPLQRHSTRSPFRTHTVTRARGHLALGAWTVAVEDTVGADHGTLSGFSMDLECM